MNDDRESPGDEQSQGMTLSDIYFVLFRQKWLIILFSVVGVLGAVALLAVNPLQYQSTTKLFIRYVVTGKTLNPSGAEQNTRPLGEQENSIISTEMEILMSFDLARQVAAAVGPERMLAKAGGGTDLDQAGGLVLQNLAVELPANGSVILITFRHPDPEIARETLIKVIDAYYKKHAEAHIPVKLFGDFITQEIGRLREQLARTDSELKAAKTSAGVTSVEEWKHGYSQQMSSIREQLFNAQAELASHQAALGEVTNVSSSALETTNTITQPTAPLERLKDYEKVCKRLDFFARKEQELLLEYKETSTPIQELRNQIEAAETLKKQLEQAYPGLAKVSVPSSTSAGLQAVTPRDLTAEATQVRMFKSKIEVLKSQSAQLQSEAAKVEEMEGTIQELQRMKGSQEDDLKYFSAKLEQSRIDKAAGTGNAPNIGIIEPPTPAAKKWPKSFKKKVVMVAAGCAASGVALAFLIELFLDGSVRRPGEVETKLRLPLFISIPDISRNGKRRLAKAGEKDLLRMTDAKGEAAGEIGMMKAAAGVSSHPLRDYYEGLRDRLITYFEVKNLDQKPKLLGVTSCGEGVGVSTIATGLAASLSESGGNVLLVDMNAEQGGSQEFHKGKPGCRLDDTVRTETMNSALVRANAHAGDERVDGDKLPQLLPARFAGLMPKLNARHYDYIVFDLPPVSQTSLTPRLARIMDMVLLVIESEKTSRDAVKQASSLLSQSKANVSVVLNKERTHLPKWLRQGL